MADKTHSVLTKKKQVLGHSLILSGYSDDQYYTSIVRDEGLDDEDVLTMLKVCLNKTGPGTILDVGANIGYISTMMSSFSPKSKIYSFEPANSNVVILKKNIELNKLKNIKVEAYGLGSQAFKSHVSWDTKNRGSAFISNQHNEFYQNEESVDVKVLDKIYNQLGIKDCKLMKVDIEGFERQFLMGSKDFIKKFKPVLVMEVNHWCLNGLHNTTLPDFLGSLFGIYPNITAFWGKQTIDVKKHTAIFMHENIVKNHYMNIVCSFDSQTHQDIVAIYQKAAKHIDLEDHRDIFIAGLQDENNSQKTRINDLEKEKELMHRQQRDVRFLGNRLQAELQLKLNKKANPITSSRELYYANGHNKHTYADTENISAEQLAVLAHEIDENNIRFRKSKVSSHINRYFWRGVAKSFFLSTKIAKKVIK